MQLTSLRRCLRKRPAARWADGRAAATAARAAAAGCRWRRRRLQRQQQAVVAAVQQLGEARGEQAAVPRRGGCGGRAVAGGSRVRQGSPEVHPPAAARAAACRVAPRLPAYGHGEPRGRHGRRRAGRQRGRLQQQQRAASGQQCAPGKSGKHMGCALHAHAGMQRQTTLRPAIGVGACLGKPAPRAELQAWIGNSAEAHCTWAH